MNSVQPERSVRDDGKRLEGAWLFRTLLTLYRLRKPVETALGDLHREQRQRIADVVTMRVWLHAHVFSAILSVFMLFLKGQDSDSGETSTATALLLMGVGSFSGSVFELLTGRHSAVHGSRKTISRGIRWMNATMLVYAGIALGGALWGDRGFPVWSLLALAQLLIGLPLALVNGPDSAMLSDAVEDIPDKATRRAFEGVGSAAKYFGITLAATLGSAIFSLAIFLTQDFREAAGWTGLVFLLTIFTQRRAARALARVRDETEQTDLPPPPERPIRQAWNYVCTQMPAGFAHALLALGLVEGCILFATYYFGLEALKELYIAALPESDTTTRAWIVPLLAAPALVALIEFVGSVGGRSQAAQLLSRKPHPRAGAPSPADDDTHAWIGSTLGTLVCVAVLFGFHLFLTRVPFAAEPLWKGAIAVVFYALFKLLRTFIVAELRSVIMAPVPRDERWLKATIISIASAFTRGSHIVMALLHVGLVAYTSMHWSDAPPNGASSVAASVVIVLVLSILIVLLDRVPRRPHARRRSLRTRGGVTVYLLNRDQFTMLILFTTLFLVSLVAANLLAYRQITLFGASDSAITFNGGSIVYALSAVALILAQAACGLRAGVLLFLSGTGTYALLTVAVLLTVGLESTPDAGVLGQELDRHLTSNYIIDLLGRSFPAFFIGQGLGVFIFHRLSLLDPHRNGTLWMRITAAIFAAQAIDSLIYVMMGVVVRPAAGASAPYPTEHFIGSLLTKWLVMSLLIPVIHPISEGIRKSWERSDAPPAGDEPPTAESPSLNAE